MIIIAFSEGNSSSNIIATILCYYSNESIEKSNGCFMHMLLVREHDKLDEAVPYI